jgi:hypothetical protein
VKSTSPTRAAAASRLSNGNMGSSYISRKRPTVLFMRLCVLIGAKPYRHSSFTVSHHDSPPLDAACLKTNELPSHTPMLYSDSVPRVSSESMVKLNSFVAPYRM